jgi:hypothetical protein
MQVFTKPDSISENRRFYLFLVDATDGITPETGEAGGQPQISKNGSGFSNTSATLVAIGNGAYYVELAQAEIDALGWILVRYKSVNTAEFQGLGQIIAQEWFRPGGRVT